MVERGHLNLEIHVLANHIPLGRQRGVQGPLRTHWQVPFLASSKRTLVTDLTSKIVWYVSRPKRAVGDMYEQMIRDAARATTLGVWYIRYVAFQSLAIIDACVRGHI